MYVYMYVVVALHALHQLTARSQTQGASRDIVLQKPWSASSCHNHCIPAVLLLFHHHHHHRHHLTACNDVTALRELQNA
jgi:hypothetical protein